MGYSSVEAYKAADGWKEFFNIQPITSAPTAIEEMQSSEELKGTPRKVLIDGQLYILNGGNTYNLQGMEVKKSKSKVQPNNLQTKTVHQH